MTENKDIVNEQEDDTILKPKGRPKKVK